MNIENMDNIDEIFNENENHQINEGDYEGLRNLLPPSNPIPIDESIEANNNDGIPEWALQFDESKFDKVVSMDEILPTLRPRLNAIYNVEILSIPFNPQFEGNPVVFTDNVTKEQKKLYKMIINSNGMNMDLICTNSILFQIETYRRKHQLKISDLVGKTMVFQKVEKLYKNKKTNMIQLQIRG